MVRENAVGPANRGLVISGRVPGETDARLNSFLVSLDPFLQSKELVARQREVSWRLELRRNFKVVPNTEIQCEILARVPGILPVHADWVVIERIARTAETLDENPRQPSTI